MALPSGFVSKYNLRPYGITIGVRTAQPNNGTVVQRTSDDGSTAPATSAAITVAQLGPGEFVVTDQRVVAGQLYWYNAYHTRPTYDNSTETDWEAAYPVQLEQVRLNDISYAEARRRTDSIYLSDSVIQSSVQQQSGSTLRNIARGRESGNSSDGAAVSFGQAFTASPMVLFEGGLSYQPATSQWSGSYSSSDPQERRVQALGLTSTGFTLEAKLVQKGVASSTGVNFPSGNTLSSEGATTVVLVSTSGQTDYTFTTHVEAELNVTASTKEAPKTLTVVVARDSYDGSAWTERGTRTYSVVAETPGSTDTLSIADDARIDTISSAALTTSTDNWRVRIKSVTVTGVGGSYDFTIHGLNAGSTDSDVDHGVTWPMTTEATASMTPASGDYVTWEAIEV